MGINPIASLTPLQRKDRHFMKPLTKADVIRLEEETGIPFRTAFQENPNPGPDESVYGNVVMPADMRKNKPCDS